MDVVLLYIGKELWLVKRILLDKLSRDFVHIPLSQPYISRKFIIDCLGGRTRRKYFEFDEKEGQKHGSASILELFAPSMNEEYFDWVDLFEAITAAKDVFTMLELGAGNGRWSVFGALAARAAGKKIGRLGAYEAEPTHYTWTVRHYIDNGIDPAKHNVVKAAVGPENGMAKFFVGCPSAWYGQSIAPDNSPVTPKTKQLLQRLLHRENPGDTVIEVGVISLKSILSGYTYVDFIHMDIQGSELDVIASSIDELDQKVRKVHIGTHSPDVSATGGRDVEEKLRQIFNDRHWSCVHDVKALSTEVRIDGWVTRVCDGIQTWLNPRWQW